MKESTTQKRLHDIMSDRNIKQVDILNLCKPYSEKYGIKLSKSDLSQYISGKVEPGNDKIFILSKALNVSERYLMGWESDISTSDSLDIDHQATVSALVQKYPELRPIKKRSFPMLGKVACGQPIMANKDYDSFVVADADIDADFCLTASGDSMINARILDGDIVFIRKQEIVDNGDIAAVVIDDEVTLKRFFYYRSSQTLRLQPENPMYEPMLYSGEELAHIHVLGKVVCFQSIVR